MDQRMTSLPPALAMCRRSVAKGQLLEAILAEHLAAGEPKVHTSQITQSGLTSHLESWNLQQSPVRVSFPLTKTWHPFASLPDEPRLQFLVAIEAARFVVKLQEWGVGFIASTFGNIDDEWTFADLAEAISRALQSPKLGAALNQKKSRWLSLAMPRESRASALASVARALGATNENGADLVDWDDGRGKGDAKPEVSEADWRRALGAIAENPNTPRAIATALSLERGCDDLQIRLALELALLVANGVPPGRAPTAEQVDSRVAITREDVDALRERFKRILEGAERPFPDSLRRLVGQLSKTSVLSAMPYEEMSRAEPIATRAVPRSESRTSECDGPDLADRLAELQLLNGWTVQQRIALTRVLVDFEKDENAGKTLSVIKELAGEGASPEELVVVIRLREWLRWTAAAEARSPSYSTLYHFVKSTFRATPDPEEAVRYLEDRLAAEGVPPESWGVWIHRSYGDVKTW